MSNNNTTPTYSSRENFIKLANKFNTIPVCVEIISDYETVLSAYQKIRQDNSCNFLLESTETSDSVGRYSILGTKPREILIFQNGETKVFSATTKNSNSQENPQEENNFEKTDPAKAIETHMSKYLFPPKEDLSFLDEPFIGGAVGYFSFDCVRFFEPTVTKIKSQSQLPKDDLCLPDSVFIVIDTALVFDNKNRTLKIISNAYLPDFSTPKLAYESAQKKINSVLEQLRKTLPHSNEMIFLQSPKSKDGKKEINSNDELTYHSNTQKSEFINMVESCKDYIKAGDIFQVVPSQRFETNYSGSPLELYRTLRFINPSPYLFCLEFHLQNFGTENFALVGSSPEVHVRCQDRTAELRPIAGTRWRGKTLAEDEKLVKELLQDEKEIAEHVMLIDLARNDLGRVSEYGSVKVTEKMIVEKYSHVMHIVSNVRSKLKPDFSSYDLLRATFPAGTVSGAPKIRAMQIIYELEKNKRNNYAGAICYFGFNGNLDSCIALRTALLKNSKAYVQAGGGIVADSEPEYEFNESCNKAAAMLTAIKIAKKYQA